MVAFGKFKQRFFGSSPAESAISDENLTIVGENDVLRITTLGNADSPNAFICFTGIKHAMGGIRMEEFVGSTRLPGYFAIFITDLKRSWFNAFPPTSITGPIAPLIAGKRLVTIGNSMGGFGAIWATRHLPVDVAIAFCPQFSVHPEEVPKEERWMDYRRQITDWRVRSLEDHFVSETSYITINGGGMDEMHWRRFPAAANCNHLLVENSQHDTAKYLKDQGVLAGVIETAANGDDPFPNMVEAGLAPIRI